MKKEQNRYILAEYCGTIEEIYNSKEEYDEFVRKIKRNNSKKGITILSGNIRYRNINGKYHVSIDRYNILIPRTTISKLDDETSTYYDEEEFIKKNKVKLKTKHPKIRVIYFEDINSKKREKKHIDIRICSIDVFYGKYKKYYNYEYIKRCIEYYSNVFDISFFKKLATFVEKNKYISDMVAKLREIANRPLDDYTKGNLYSYADKLCFNHIIEREKNGKPLKNKLNETEISRRRQRDTMFFMLNYDVSRNNKIENNYQTEYMKRRINKEEESKEEEDQLDRWDFERDNQSRLKLVQEDT